MSKRWRCQNAHCSEDKAGRLIFDFVADEPVCPKCGTSRETHPTIIVPLVAICFDPPSNISGRGLNKAACKKQRPQAMTGDPSVVTCDDCRQALIFRDLDAAGWKPGAAMQPGVEVRPDPEPQTESAEA